MSTPIIRNSKMYIVKNIDMIETPFRSEYEINEYIYDIGISEKYCPICQMIRVDSKDMKKYIYKKFELTEENMIKEIKEKFSSYNEFKEYLKN